MSAPAGEHLYLNHELNPGVNGVRLNHPTAAVFSPGRTTAIPSIHGLQTKMEHSLQSWPAIFRGAYTFSKSIDNGSEVFVTSGGSTRGAGPNSLFRGDRGLSAF